ncbi:flagellar brake protein [Gilvimarinus polysaccharolyticus]|uniref:flagellar brake protein n=1 Tax=Gilvimarinus polysaccharolyticus TaxID=863921 RepID=UPI0006735A88|nr:PilZ domain-containing protein [Gilvimarinus polysaccharolyticus]
MKQNLWRQLTRPFKELTRKSPLSAPHEPTQNQASAACIETLAQWQQARRILNVESNQWPNLGQSLILAIDAKRELLWLDDVFPAQDSLAEGQSLRVSLRQGFERCYFTSTVIAIVHKTQGRMIALYIPAEIHRAPRRIQPRFILPGPTLNAKIRAAGLHPESCQVINISAGGMRVALNGNLLKHYRPGSVLPYCHFALSPDIIITCSGIIKAATLDKSIGRKTKVSLSFADITFGQRQQITAYLHKLQILDDYREVAIGA